MSEGESGTDEIWRASASPVESFSDAEGANEDGEWPVEVIGEEVDGSGKIRYEVRWGNWHRPDGSDVTWNDKYLTSPSIISTWEQMQTIRRDTLLHESLAIDIWSTTDIVQTQTRLRAQAFEEKLAARRRKPVDLPQRMARLLAEKMGGVHGDSRAASVKSSASVPRGRLRQTAARARASRSMSEASMEQSVRSGRSSVTLGSGERPTPSNPSPASSPAPVTEKSRAGTVEKELFPEKANRITRSLPSRVHSARRREQLQREWNGVARSCRAAEIIFTNEIDAEETPSLVRDFRYIESEYSYSRNVPQLSDDDVFVRCDCAVCDAAHRCGCQEPSEVVDVDGRKDYAYTPEGLFSFNVPPGVEVIECNKLCRCDETCPNRIAQRPRDIPVEIFKTVASGWGVRSTADVKKGKVLGIYTGLLMRREDVEELPDDEKSYCFDLDGREGPDEPLPDNAYSVDSRQCGNWTRFINHSCAPNLRVYLVVYASIPEMNAPYLAFVATEDIPAQTEFTFDYDPGAGETEVKGKGKGRMEVPDGAKPCMCGSGGCRGWVRV